MDTKYSYVYFSLHRANLHLTCMLFLGEGGFFLVLFYKIIVLIFLYTECRGGNVPDFGRMFLRLKYTDITQNTYIRI
jgi:hypothetical protein